MKATIVIPTLNEADGIGHTIDHLKLSFAEGNRSHFAQDPIEWSILVVDGLSRDRTVEIAREHGAQVVLESRKGYGRAFLAGFAAAKSDLLITLDGDGTYPARMVPELVRYLIDKDLDFVVGDRLQATTRASMPWTNLFGNIVLGLSARILFSRAFRNQTLPFIPDIESGMWVFRRRSLDVMSLSESGTEFSQEIKIEAASCGLRYAHVNIPYAPRLGESKLSPFRDGLLDIKWMFARRFVPDSAIGNWSRAMLGPLYVKLLRRVSA